MQQSSYEQMNMASRTTLQRVLDIATLGLKVVFFGPGACTILPKR